MIYIDSPVCSNRKLDDRSRTITRQLDIGEVPVFPDTRVFGLGEHLFFLVQTSSPVSLGLAT